MLGQDEDPSDGQFHSHRSDLRFGKWMLQPIKYTRDTTSISKHFQGQSAVITLEDFPVCEEGKWQCEDGKSIIENLA